MSDPAFRLITFDLDDTLWPCASVIQAAEEAVHRWLTAQAPRLAEAHDIVSLRQQRRELMEREPAITHDLGRVRHRSLAELLDAFGYPADLADDAMSLFMVHRNRVEPYADVLPTLRRLTERYLLVSLTNGNADVEATPLRGVFQFSITAAEVGAAKPDPALFRRALDLAGCAPSDCLHLGDDPWLDVEAARRLGLGTVWVNRTARRWPDELAPPDRTVTSLRELDAWLDGAHTGDIDGF